MNAMNFPDFFDQVPCITLRDPLADLLGSATGGLMRYGYADAVRLAGHSCPTVASAYWLGVRAIKSLFSDEIPIRGDIEVSLRDPLESGTTGVVANVLGLLMLLIAFRDVVAQASLAAMTFRIVVWLIILALMVAARKKQIASQYN